MKIRFGDFRYGAPKAGVSNPAPGGLVSCRVQLQPRLKTHLNQLIKVLLGILETSRQVC